MSDRYFSNNKKEKKPWFTRECWVKRKAFRIGKRRYKNNHSIQNREFMKNSEREYKREMDKAIAQHRKNMRKKIDKLKKDNSKEFWKFFNRHKKQHRENSNISINILYEFFKDLNSTENDNGNTPMPDFQDQGLNAILNSDITETEIMKCIKTLKNGKACGDDLIINEYIKSTSHLLMPIYVKLFNIVFNSGIIPETWAIGTILPFYKNKGAKSDPKNYRPITILSCLGKLFTSIINLRLGEFLDRFLLLNENQSGFRKGYSTIDSIFTLYIVFELLKLKKKKLVCAFIDFAKAFDTVWRPGLWFKLLKNYVNGKMYDVIVNMYSNIKSRVYNGAEFSEFFPCNVGVRQGENLSPVLFSIYLNDLDNFLSSKNLYGVSIVSDEEDAELGLFLKLFTILYADDTVLLAESVDDLQEQLNCLSEYCNLWKLKVNVDKSKVMVFTKGRLPNNVTFTYNDIVLDIVNEFNYLGVIFTNTGNFSKAKKANVDKATRAMYDILKQGRIHNLSIDCQLDLFDKIVQPILLYGCEVWGYGNNKVIERVHLKFCKLLLQLKKSTPDFMIYGELGRYSLDIRIKLRMLNYWSKLIAGKPEKLPVILYNIALKKTAMGHNIPWLNDIKRFFNYCGFSHIWDTHYFISTTWLYNSVKQRLLDQFSQNWYSHVQNSPKALNYRIFKDKLEFENYLKLLDNKKAIDLCRFRTSNHNLPIESGRWRNIPRENRTCPLCNSNDVGDEFHYLFTCSSLLDDRKLFLKSKYRNRPNVLKLQSLMQSKNCLDLTNLCKLIKVIVKNLESPG